MAAIHASRALSLVGVPFRPQGRDQSGLDCVGVCLASYQLSMELVRADYRLRGSHKREIEEYLSRHFRKTVPAKRRPGDLMLMQVGPDQLHLGIRTRRGFVHAEARLRRVVETPGDPVWPLIGVYRRRIGTEIR